MPYTAVTGVSSLPVLGAKMALSVGTRLKKDKERPQNNHFSCIVLLFIRTHGKCHFCSNYHDSSVLHFRLKINYRINMVLYSR